jgi:hypothetical protein
MQRADPRKRGQRDGHRTAHATTPTAVEPPTARHAPARAPRVESRRRRRDRLKPVLNKGANITVAAEGFRSARGDGRARGRNTEVPFLLLKHRC